MSDYKKGYSKDGIYSDVMEKFDDTLDLFTGTKIEIVKEDEAKEDSEEIDGLETLVKTFSNYNFKSFEEEEISGEEGIGSFVGNALSSLWQLIKDIFSWIGSLFNNKITRIESKFQYTKQQRKINGIKNNEVKYPSSCRNLLTPNLVSDTPDWVKSAGKFGVDIYKSFIKAQTSLRKEISIIDEGLYSEKRKAVIELLVKDLEGSFNFKNNAHISDIYPGNRVLNILDPEGKDINQALMYFTDSSVPVKFKKETFTPTPVLIDGVIDTAEELVKLIKDNQSNTSSIQKEFEKKVKELMDRNKKILPEQRQYLSWLVILNKRITSLGLQYTNRVLDGLIGFINAGIK